jgi:hypothetical protein
MTISESASMDVQPVSWAKDVSDISKETEKLVPYLARGLLYASCGQCSTALISVRFPWKMYQRPHKTRHFWCHTSHAAGYTLLVGSVQRICSKGCAPCSCHRLEPLCSRFHDRHSVCGVCKQGRGITESIQHPCNAVDALALSHQGAGLIFDTGASLEREHRSTRADADERLDVSMLLVCHVSSFEYLLGQIATACSRQCLMELRSPQEQGKVAPANAVERHFLWPQSVLYQSAHILGSLR